MTTRRPFNYRALIVEWRARCRQEGLDPRTGCPLDVEAVYRTGDDGRRLIARIPVLPDPPPEPLCDPASATWWQLPMLWAEAGDHHSSVEAEALANIAAETRRIAGVREPATLDAVLAREFRQIVREVMAEEMPLRDLHKRRGVEVIMLEGVRMEVPVKEAV